MQTLQIDRTPSPIGEIMLVVDETGLVALDYADYENRMLKLLARRFGSFELMPAGKTLDHTVRLQAYFAGNLSALDDAPVSLGGTPFQQLVWNSLRTIAPGTTRTYGELALLLDRPTAARAVGMTNSLNPISIVLPCHRVVGANAALTGYAGGLERKAWLLAHERGQR